MALCVCADKLGCQHDVYGALRSDVADHNDERQCGRYDRLNTAILRQRLSLPTLHDLQHLRRFHRRRIRRRQLVHRCELIPL